MKRTIAFSLLLLAAVACLRPDLESRFTPAWEPFDPVEEGWRTSRPVMLIADPQIHNLYSKPVPERNLSAEAAAATAIRAPQLDMFSPDVLSWIIKNGAPETEAIIVLGDALDLACEGEWETFVDVMNGAGKPWFLAPGNHDFYYFGTYDPQKPDVWEDACSGAGRPLTKDRFIRSYVAALMAQDDPGCIALAEALGMTGQPVSVSIDGLPLSFEWRAPPDTGGFFEAICWNIDMERPWRSFILQSLDFTRDEIQDFPTHALLLDSCQYSRRPILIPNAWKSYPAGLNCGLTGEMLPDQLRKVREWLEIGDGYTLMSHHPFDDFAPRTRSSLGFLWREFNVGLMVTAHTHQGYFAHHDVGGELDQLELNMGSTTDWPMEWRTLMGYINTETEQIYIRCDRYTLVDVLQNQEGYFLLDWEVPLDAPDDYRKYKQGEAASALLIDFALAHHLVPYWLPQPLVRANAAARATEESVKDTMLWTYFRLVQYFPTDLEVDETIWPSRCRTDRQVIDRIVALSGEQEALDKKVAFLQELEKFEKSRKTRELETGRSMDEDRLRFKLSQAAWASRFENSEGRRLRVEDNLIRIDWDKAMERRQRISGR